MFKILVIALLIGYFSKDETVRTFLRTILIEGIKTRFLLGLKIASGFESPMLHLVG